MPGNAFLLILLLVVGCAAFIFSVIYLFCRLFSWVGRGVLGARKPCGQTRMSEHPVGGSQRRVCPNVQCRKVEHRREARFCSQCGGRLT